MTTEHENKTEQQKQPFDYEELFTKAIQNLGELGRFWDTNAEFRMRCSFSIAGFMQVFSIKPEDEEKVLVLLDFFQSSMALGMAYRELVEAKNNPEDRAMAEAIVEYTKHSYSPSSIYQSFGNKPAGGVFISWPEGM